MQQIDDTRAASSSAPNIGANLAMLLYTKEEQHDRNKNVSGYPKTKTAYSPDMHRMKYIKQLISANFQQIEVLKQKRDKLLGRYTRSNLVRELEMLQIEMDSITKEIYILENEVPLKQQAGHVCSNLDRILLAYSVEHSVYHGRSYCFLYCKPKP